MSEPETIRFPVRGMTCSSCVSRIVRAVRRLEGVRSVSVDLRRELATVRRDGELVSDEQLESAISAAGYEADVGAAVVVPGEARPGVVARLLSLVRQA